MMLSGPVMIRYEEECKIFFELVGSHRINQKSRSFDSLIEILRLVLVALKLLLGVI